MQEEKKGQPSSMDMDEIDAWLTRDLEDVLTEAEDEGSITAAKEAAKNGGWIEPTTVEEYLMWFEVLVEKAIKDASYSLGGPSLELYTAHHMAAYVAEFRCFGIKPASRPWELGLLQLDPEIHEGMRNVIDLVHRTVHWMGLSRTSASGKDS